MEFWLHEVIAPQAILRNVGFALLVVSSGMSSMLLLRIAALAAGVVFLIAYSVFGYEPDTPWWSLVDEIREAVRIGAGMGAASENGDARMLRPDRVELAVA